MATIRREVRQKQEEELKECNFHPKVNLISQKVDQELGDHSLRQHKRVERYELLYSNYLHLETKRNSRQEHALD